MTSSSELPAEAPVLRRLHPWSWLFVLLSQLREFALPLIVLLFFGRGGDWQEIAAAVSAAALTLVAVWRYFTYRYMVTAQELVIRSGLLSREVRHLPFARIHNIELRQSPIHRLFSVAEVRVESATGERQAEAQMQVLALAEARLLVERVRQQQAAAVADPLAEHRGEPPAAATSERLARVSVGELLWLGLSSNRGWVVIGVLMGVFWQLDPQSGWRMIPRTIEWLMDQLHQRAPSLGWAAGALLLVLLASLLVRLLGVLMVQLRYHGFVLGQIDDRLTTEGGLLTRVQSFTRRTKIQRWVIKAPWLLVRRGLRGLHVETAAAVAEDGQRGIDAVLPAAPATVVDGLLQRWLPHGAWADIAWQPIHPRAWRRMLKWPLLLFCLGVGVLVLNVGSKALPLLALAVWPLWASWRDAGFRAYSVNAQRVLWREGAWSRRWEVVECSRIQGLRLEQSVFDRRAGMAHLVIDTAGVRANQSATTLSYLPAEAARELFQQLSRAVERAASVGC